jgi:hypothetical protein
MRYFAYSPDCGMEFFNTAKEARDHADACIDDYKESSADDGWGEDVTAVCWGEVKEQASQTNVREPPTGSGFEFFCDYELTNVAVQQELLQDNFNSFAATLLAESLLRSPVAPCTVGDPWLFDVPVNRRDMPAWAGVRITLEAIPSPTAKVKENTNKENDK